jgi:DNA-binding response OmpR family regulator
MEKPRSHVLVVDDNRDMCNPLSDYLGTNDFYVTAVTAAKQMLDFIASEATNLLLLEPRLRLTRIVRESSSMPIVAIFEGDEVVDRAMGIEFGADDYVTRPVSPREFIAHIRAVLRQYGSTSRVPRTSCCLNSVFRIVSADQRLTGRDIYRSCRWWVVRSMSIRSYEDNTTSLQQSAPSASDASGRLRRPTMTLSFLASRLPPGNQRTRRNA